MPKRYLFVNPPAGAETVARAVPGAVVTLTRAGLEVIVPDAVIGPFDRSLPAAPIEVEDVSDLVPRTLIQVRADLLEAVIEARGRGNVGLSTAVDELTSDATTRTTNRAR